MANLGANFYSKLVSISNDLGMKPEDILAVMISESGINPASHEPKHNGGGLLGFMPDTLKALHFDGTPEDFRELNGEQQLDYAKKIIKGFMSANGGKPFESATQYYIANFVPAALNLPGIKEKDPNYAFVEENPETVRGKDGTLYSKKYYDIGVKWPASIERQAYEGNHLFHGNVKGAITYADMERQVNKNKQTPTYKNAITAMKASTGYVATNDKPSNTVNNSSNSEGKDTSSLSSYISIFMSKIKDWVDKFDNFVFAAESKNTYLIAIGSSRDYTTTLEYGRVLAEAIENYLNAKVTIYSNASNIDIECELPGHKQEIFDALKELSISVGEAFNQATPKLGNIKTSALVNVGVKSDHEILHPEIADIEYRKFKIKYASFK